MKSNKNKKSSFNKKELEPAQIWNEDKLSKLQEFISKESKKQTPERRLRNELLAIKYQMQDYLDKNTIENEMRIIDFVKLFIKVLNISQKDLANAFEMKDTNLYKYLTGERKLNTDLVLKLSSFSHTAPELWYYIEIKNELYELKKLKDKVNKYQKYDYINFVQGIR